MAYRLKYRPPGPVAAAFLAGRPVMGDGTIPVDVIRGPIGSGKSVACVIKLLTLIMEQAPGPDGWRRSRWAIVRNTNPELEMTTVKTWLEWLPEEYFGPFRWAKPYRHEIRLPGAKVEAEVWFVPLDDEAAVRKLLSLELTGAWVNEAREIPRAAITALRSRCNRYPSRRDGGPGATWAGVLMDTNSPDEDHYLAYWEGVVEPPEWMGELEREQMRRPEGVTFHTQPPGLKPVYEGRRLVGWEENPDAENLAHLPPGYYRTQVAGNTVRWLLAMCANRYGPLDDVRTVYPEFDRALHVAPRPIEAVEGLPLLLGGDFARNPAVVVGQEVEGQLRILAEFCGENIDVRQYFSSVVVPGIKARWPGLTYRGWGDPTGGHRTGGDEFAAFDHAREAGLPLLKGWTNDPDRRIAAVSRRLTTNTRGGPSLLLSPRCTTLVQGFASGYRLQKIRLPGENRWKEEPEKNRYSHPHDGLQYLVSNHDRAYARDDRSQEQRRAAATAQVPNGRVRFDPLALSRASRRRAL